MGKGVAQDANGVEYSLQYNVGELRKVTWPPNGKRNGSLEISVPGFQYAVGGSFDARNTELVSSVRILEEKAKTDGPVYVAFRLEVHRDREKVEATVPWDEVPTEKEFRHRRIVEIAEDGTPAGNDILNRAEAEAQGETVAPKPVANEPSPSTPMPSGGGQVDTYAFSASLGMATLAFETLQRAKAVGEIDSFKPGDIEHLTRRLNSVADALQGSVTDGKVNRNANSHTRARGVVRTVIEAYPIPVTTQDAEGWDAWENVVTRAGSRLMAVAKKLHDEYLAAAG